MRSALATALLLAVAGPAWAQEAPFQSSTTGALLVRGTGAHVRSNGLISADPYPRVQLLEEANLQVQLKGEERFTVGADLSFVHQLASGFVRSNSQGESGPVPAVDSALFRPYALVSEAYADVALHPRLRLTVGKKRVVWGSGLAQNPTDLLNPAKDPTDPSSQRAGAWLARIEAPFDRFTFTLLGAAQVTRQTAGLPTALLFEPEHATLEQVQRGTPFTADPKPHFALAARIYALLWDTDLQLMWLFTRNFQDSFPHAHRLGFSASRALGDWEVHVEGTLQQGSSRLVPERGCASSANALFGCLAAGRAPTAASRLEDGVIRPRLLAGTRWLSSTSSLLSLEYVFEGDGFAADDFRTQVALARASRELSLQQPALAPRLASALSGQPQDGAPVRFAFRPLRRHYLFASFSQPGLWDDFTAQVAAVVGLEDLSATLAPGVSWSARSWLTLGADLFATLPGVPVWGAETGAGRRGELGLSPTDLRAVLTARLFF